MTPVVNIGLKKKDIVFEVFKLLRASLCVPFARDARVAKTKTHCKRILDDDRVYDRIECK